MKPLAEFTKRPTPRQGAPGRKCWVRVILWESVTYLPARRRTCAANAYDGSDSVFWGRPDAVVVLITSEMGHKQTSCRPRSPAMSADLAFVDARGGCGVVLVVTPRRMMEMDDEIAIV